MKYNPIDAIYNTVHNYTHTGAVWAKEQLRRYLIKISVGYLSYEELNQVHQNNLSFQELIDLTWLLLLVKEKVNHDHFQ